MIFKKLIFALVLMVLQASVAYGAVPTIKSVADQRTNQGEIYTYRPKLINGGVVNWSKEYGPDDVFVNSKTGLVVWRVPSNLPDESFHIGVRASNKDGSYFETWVLTVGGGNIIFMGHDETLKTLSKGMSAMESGDTLIIRDGVYINENKENSIPGPSKKGQAPPSGTPGKFTTVIAENPGGVIIDGQGTQQYLIFIYGSYNPPDFSSGNGSTARKYIAIKGIHLRNSRNSALRIEFGEDIKYIDMSVENSGSVSGGNTPNVYVRRSNRILIEGLHSWGHSRYKMQFKDTTNSIARRSIARIDDYRGSQPIGGFIAYCSRNIVFQNNIVVDGNREEFWTDFKNHANLYGVPATGCAGYPRGIVFSRNIGLNSNVGLMLTAATKSSDPVIWEDMVGWGLDIDRYNAGTGNQVPVLSGAGPSDTNRLTLGNITADPGYDVAGGRAFFYSRSEDSKVTNSILYNLGWNGSQTVDQGPLSWSNSSGNIDVQYNNIFNFSGDLIGGGGSEKVANNFAGDPDLKYIVRVEGGSFLENSGKNGAAVGANVTTFIGKSGTFYGDPGYDQETNIAMWPFPHEAQAREQMKGYSYTGTVRGGSTRTLSGVRGFTVDGETLTNYVWGYLGNTVPPFNVAALPGDKKMTITWQLPAIKDRATISQYRIYNALPIGSAENVIKTVLASADPITEITGLNNGVTYDFYVTAVDSNKGESSYSYKVSAAPVEVIAAPDPINAN